MKTPGNYFDAREHIKSVQGQLDRMDIPAAPIGRCIHCGDTRKNHLPNGRCRTRLKDTKFDPWTEKEWEDAVRKGQGLDPLPAAVPPPVLPSAVEVNRFLRAGSRSVYGILVGDAPGGGKRRIFGYRKPRGNSFAEGRLQNGSWIQLKALEIE